MPEMPLHSFKERETEESYENHTSGIEISMSPVQVHLNRIIQSEKAHRMCSLGLEVHMQIL